MATENSIELIKRYLEDAIAAEKSFEPQLRAFAREAVGPQMRALFEQRADQTRLHYEMLTERLNVLGGSPSGLKSFLANVFNLAPKAERLGRNEEERAMQNLMIAYAVENSEVALYEFLIAAGEHSGDQETAGLARQIQLQEKAAAEKIWRSIAPVARQAYDALTAARVQ